MTDRAEATARVRIAHPTVAVDEPVGAVELAAWSADIAALSPPARAELVGVLNMTRAPCEPCWSQEESLARCALSAPSGCENLPELVARATRVAAAGGGRGALRAVLTYGDVWLPVGSGEGRGWPDPGSPVVVELWIDPGAGLWREAVGTARELAARSAERADLGALSITTRLFPTWTWRGEAPSPGAEELHRALAAADRLGQGVPLLAALADQDGDVLDVEEARRSLDSLQGEAWTTALAAAEEDLAADAACARAIGLRVAPSWRVDGYRLRGPQGLATLFDIVETQWLDHHPDLPVALLSPQRSAVGASK